MKSARIIDHVIAEHLNELSKPSVLSIRPGYQACNGWPTTKPAIVVTVDRKARRLTGTGSAAGNARRLPGRRPPGGTARTVA